MSTTAFKEFIKTPKGKLKMLKNVCLLHLGGRRMTKKELQKLYLKELKRRFQNIYGRTNAFRQEQEGVSDFLHIVYETEFERVDMYVCHTLLVRFKVKGIAPTSDYMLRSLLDITRDLEQYIYYYLFHTQLYEITGQRG